MMDNKPVLYLDTFRQCGWYNHQNYLITIHLVFFITMATINEMI